MKIKTAITAFLVLAALIVLAASPGFALDVKPQTPAVVTTCGKSPGALMIRLICKRAKVACDQNDDITAADLAGGKYKTLIVTMGTSGKGMGAAGTDIDAEVARVKKVIAEAKKLKMTVIGAHVEGMARRTDKSDQLSIDVVTAGSDILVYTDDGNPDGYFSNLAKEKKLKAYHCKERMGLIEVFKQIF